MDGASRGEASKSTPKGAGGEKWNAVSDLAAATDVLTVGANDLDSKSPHATPRGNPGGKGEGPGSMAGQLAYSFAQIAGAGISQIGKAFAYIGKAFKAASRAWRVAALNKGTARVPIEKFTDYVFKDGATHGKDAVFRSLGYGKEHSERLAQLWKKQAAEKFKAGDYGMGKLDEHGQRIDIEIAVPGRGEASGKTSYLRSGWMMNEDGSIRMTTPFSGFTRSK